MSSGLNCGEPRAPASAFATPASSRGAARLGRAGSRAWRACRPRTRTRIRTWRRWRASGAFLRVSSSRPRGRGRRRTGRVVSASGSDDATKNRCAGSPACERAGDHWIPRGSSPRLVRRRRLVAFIESNASTRREISRSHILSVALVSFDVRHRNSRGAAAPPASCRLAANAAARGAPTSSSCCCR